MNEHDDRLLRQLAELAREQARSPKARALQDAAAGALQQGDRARLLAQAGDRAAVERELRAHAPLPDVYKRELVRRAVEAAQDAESQDAESQDAEGQDAAAGRLDRAAPQGEDTDDPEGEQRARSRSRLLWIAPPLAAAAAALIYLALPARTAPLPDYALQVSGGQALLRGAAGPADAPTRVDSGTRLKLLLRPQTAVQGELAVAVYLVSQGRATAWANRVERADSGALRLVLDPPPAPIVEGSVARIVIARPSAADDARALALKAGPARGDRFQRFEIPLQSGKPDGP